MRKGTNPHGQSAGVLRRELMRSRYQSPESLTVLFCVSWSTWTSPNRWSKPETHSRLSRKLQTK